MADEETRLGSRPEAAPGSGPEAAPGSGPKMVPGGGRDEASGDDRPTAIEREAIAYVGALFAGNAGGHDLGHTLRVWRNALDIAGHEPSCDREVVALAALLHDADDHKLFDTEREANARAFLGGQRLDVPRTEAICEAIASVSFSRNGGRRPQTLEGRIVQDADRLDAIGAIGIARAFAYGGEHRRPLEASVQHFHDKLLLLRNLMNTDRGRELAESRHAFLLAYLRELDAETAGSMGR